MGKNSGYLVKWTDKNGATKHGAVIHREQEQSFRDVKKLFVRYMAENFMDFERDADGKKVVGLVDMDKCRVCGMYD